MDISSDLKQLMIDFALNEDLDYRLKRHENILLIYGFNYCLDLYADIVRTTEQIFELENQSTKHLPIEHFKKILTYNADAFYKNLITKIEENNALQSDFLRQYIQIYKSEMLAENLKSAVAKYSHINAYFSFPEIPIMELSSNEHLEKLFKD